MRWISILAVAAVCTVSKAAQISARPTRIIEGGTVIGKATPVTSAGCETSVYNYLGIPFAAKPTGALRFAPPVSPTTLSAPLQATSLPPACIQQFLYPEDQRNVNMHLFANPGGPPLAESEDCLYLNVFTPTNASPKNTKPVLFWIFGGNLQFGSGSLLMYNGSSFAGFQDTVVVTANYRTNVFGFSNSPELPPTSRNAGMLDQRAALEWVQKNVASFGGDPKRVTIFGESAGGYSVKQLLANPPSPLPYRAAIMESEATSLVGNSTASYETLARNVSCSTAYSKLDCLRRVPASQLKNVIEKSSLIFGPTFENVTASSDVRPNIASKRWANVPFFLGTNADEGRVFVFVDGLDVEPSPVTLKQGLNKILPGNDTLQDAIVAEYTDYQKSVNGSVYLTLGRIITDFQFGCPAALLSSTTAANGYTDSWRYYYNASFPNLDLFRDAGAWHSSEIAQVFGTYDSLGAPVTAEQRGLSGVMQTAWARFARDPAGGPGWSKINSGTVAELGGRNPTGKTVISKGEVDQFCDFWNRETLNQIGL